jgi:hypothetical protein
VERFARDFNINRLHFERLHLGCNTILHFYSVKAPGTLSNYVCQWPAASLAISVSICTTYELSWAEKAQSQRK